MTSGGRVVMVIGPATGLIRLGAVGPALLGSAAYLAALGVAGLAVSGRRITRLLLR